jgi:uncharacterized membrane protein YkoI
MARRNRRYVLIGAVVLVLGAAAAFYALPHGASAGQSGELDDGKDLLPQAGITLEQAIASARVSIPGGVGEVDLEYLDGTLVFNVDVGDKDVKVDAANGAVLEATADD